MSANSCDCPLCKAMPPASAPGSLVPVEVIASTLARVGYATNATVETFVPEVPATEAKPTIFDLVKADLDTRDRIGAAAHGGRPLLANRCKVCGHVKHEHHHDQVM